MSPSCRCRHRYARTRGVLPDRTAHAFGGDGMRLPARRVHRHQYRGPGPRSAQTACRAAHHPGRGLMGRRHQHGRRTDPAHAGTGQGEDLVRRVPGLWRGRMGRPRPTHGHMRRMAANRSADGTWPTRCSNNSPKPRSRALPPNPAANAPRPASACPPAPSAAGSTKASSRPTRTGV